ncbi:GNAT family N-acetyltransferase [Corynebacterium sp. A21]|uniref:GNAT family N-acetyltransferase n=1 Tax=Corynebacterium sp. A21 TaxID=3457318 RepID=UPI003FD4D94E
MNTILTTCGSIRIRPVNPAQDTHLLHRWITHPKSAFWGALGASEEDINREYRSIADSANAEAWLLELKGSPVALAETYEPAQSPLAGHLQLHQGDIGIHLLVSPAENAPLPGLTDALFAALLRWLVDVRAHTRVLVEPDVRNTAVHAKNERAGFRDVPGLGDTDLGGKHARIQVCTAARFRASQLAGLAVAEQRHSQDTHLLSSGERAERELIAKAIREFVHERLLTVTELTAGNYRVVFGDRAIRFRARAHQLEHLSVDPASIEAENGQLLRLVDLIVSAADDLGLTAEFLPIYLEELQATLAGRARNLAAGRPSSAELAQVQVKGPRDQARHLQYVEASMTEGHPGFLANAGRGGMSEADLVAWAPELGRPTQLVWLAARRQMCVRGAVAGLVPEEFLQEQMGTHLWERLRELGGDYVPLPVHPWQWENRVTTSFATNLVHRDLVYLGTGPDIFRPQQSLRTFFNQSRPEAAYVKTAVAVRNMGFLRGLSPKYMGDTPAVNDWLMSTVGADPGIAARNVRFIREVASVGFTGDVYHAAVDKGAAEPGGHQKMLSALWRESPVPMLAPDSIAVTLAAVLHVDAAGAPLVGEWIQRSGVDAAQWLHALLEVYLYPVIRSLVHHDVVFMPHGENVILELREGLPVGSFFKDLGEEVAVVNRDRELPTEITRIQADFGDLDDAQRALSVQTDVLDGVLRHLAALLDDHGILPEAEFWRVCRNYIAAQDTGTLPILAATFRHSCLNRLQLRDPTAMVNLGDQNSSLLYAGDMPNPLFSATRTEPLKVH